MKKRLGSIKIAKSLWGKTVGVMLWKDFGTSKGLLLPSTNAIHTFFVRFPLDVVFLDKDYKVIQVVEGLRPWSFSPIVWKAKHTLELPAGSIKRHKLEINDKIYL